MGTKRSRDYVRNGSVQNLSVPPGFVSLTSVTLKRITDGVEAADLLAVGKELKPRSIAAPLSNSDVEKFKASFSQRPWISQGQFDRTPPKCDPESELSEVDMKVSTEGCAEESLLTVLVDAPVFHPSEEEFKDTLKYIAKIRPKAENYGICRIVPPPSWKPPCLLNDSKTWEASIFSTHVQNIDRLQKFCLKKKLSRLHEKMESKEPKVLLSMEDTKENQCFAVNSESESESESGPNFSLRSFKKYADEFKKQYFCKNDRVLDPGILNAVQEEEPLIATIEGEYWRIIENPTEEIEVLFGTELESKTLESGFPIRDGSANMATHSRYVESGWNLNNTPKLSGSLLPYGCYDTPAILVPQLFFAMCFASQCWRKEEHHLYSLCYMHLGDSKIWYGIPGRYCFKFMEVVKRLFPQLSKHPELLQDLVTQISPSRLKSEGIPVYRCVQNPNEFVLIFPGAYHSEFSCGLNCSESVCFAPLDWLPQGQNIVELYSEYCWKTAISHDRLLLQAATDAASALWESLVVKKESPDNELWISVCGKDGILTKVLKSRIKLEGIRRQYLCNFSSSRMFDESDTATKRECSICLYDLFLSAVSCSCSPSKYTCLRHAKQLCSCAWDAKCFFIRYQITELNLLVEALEGNLKAIHSWAKRKVQQMAGVFKSKHALPNESTVNGESSKNVGPGSNGSLVGNGRNKTVIPTPSSSQENNVHRSDVSRSTIRSSGQENREIRPSNQNIVIILSDEEDE